MAGLAAGNAPDPRAARLRGDHLFQQRIPADHHQRHSRLLEDRIRQAGAGEPALRSARLHRGRPWTCWPPRRRRRSWISPTRWTTAFRRSMIGDVTRLRQVLVNLLSNGIKFTAGGRGCGAGQSLVRAGTNRGNGRSPWQLHFLGARHRHWHSGGPVGPPVQVLQPGGRLDHAPVRRHGPWSGHQQTAGRDSWAARCGSRVCRKKAPPSISPCPCRRAPDAPPLVAGRTAAATGRFAPADRGRQSDQLPHSHPANRANGA